MCSFQLIRPACLRLSASHPQNGPGKPSYDNLLLLFLVLFHLLEPMPPDFHAPRPKAFLLPPKTDQASNSMPDLPRLRALRRWNRAACRDFGRSVSCRELGG